MYVITIVDKNSARVYIAPSKHWMAVQKAEVKMQYEIQSL